MEIEIEIDGKKYKPEDLDCNGNPYSDANPVNHRSEDCPSHWPFIPVAGEIITVQQKMIPIFAEKVISVDIARCEIKPDRPKSAASYWCFCQGCWMNGSTFDKYDKNSRVPIVAP
jgi:hypothetical protein